LANCSHNLLSHCYKLQAVTYHTFELLEFHIEQTSNTKAEFSCHCHMSLTTQPIVTLLQIQRLSHTCSLELFKIDVQQMRQYKDWIQYDTPVAATRHWRHTHKHRHSLQALQSEETVRATGGWSP